MKITEIKVDESNSLFEKTGMVHKIFSSDQRKIRYYALLIVQIAPEKFRDINLLEQQISELIRNAVKHGNKFDKSKQINVWYRFSDDEAYFIIQDEGDGFKGLEDWNIFNRKRLECIHNQDFDALGEYVSFRTNASDDNDGGNALFAAVEYWNLGMVYNNKRNCVAVGRKFEKLSLVYDF
ncbi:MAG: ATP-binding protein [Salinispira sp.]